jgi:hypothetical protein
MGTIDNQPISPIYVTAQITCEAGVSGPPDGFAHADGNTKNLF